MGRQDDSVASRHWASGPLTVFLAYPLQPGSFEHKNWHWSRVKNFPEFEVSSQTQNLWNLPFDTKHPDSRLAFLNLPTANKIVLYVVKKIKHVCIWRNSNDNMLYSTLYVRFSLSYLPAPSTIQVTIANSTMHINNFIL